MCDGRDYVREFLNLLLQVPSIPSGEVFFQFIDGLKPWARQELEHREVQGLNKAVAAAESLSAF